MSSEQGAVSVDTPDAIRKKFKSAVTDSEREIRYDPPEKPGISNLLEIMSVATGEPIAALEQRFQAAGYGDLKEAVGESVVELLTPIRERYDALRADERELQRLLAMGSEKARRTAEPTLEAMYENMGFARSNAGKFFGAAAQGLVEQPAQRAPPFRNLAETSSSPMGSRRRRGSPAALSFT